MNPLDARLYRPYGRAFEASVLTRLPAATFADAYESVIARVPERAFLTVAGRLGRTTVTFAEFDHAVKRLMGDLGRVNVLATTLPNSYRLALAAFAAPLAQKVFCPLSPFDPPERVRARLKQIPHQVSVMSAEGLRPHHPEQTRPVAYDCLSYVFTSGSTGYSKLVQQTATGWLSNTNDLIARLGIEDGDRLLTPLPLFHVNALGFLYAAFFSGSSITVLEEFWPTLLSSEIKHAQARVVSLVPNLLHLWMQTLSEDDLSQFPSLEVMNTAATYLPRALAELVHVRAPFRLNQGYGLSEAINFSALMDPRCPREVTRDLLLEHARPSIGPALSNELTLIARPGLQNGEGELAVRGFNVMLGYLGETQQPFEDGWLLTGDIARQIPNAGGPAYMIMSRQKDIIKRSGLTLSLVEVDDLLAHARGTHWDAISTAFENEVVGEELAVVVEVKDTSQSAAVVEALRERIATWPRGLQPRVLVLTNARLRTASGKPQRWRFRAYFEHLRSRSLVGLTLLDAQDVNERHDQVGQTHAEPTPE